MPTSLPQPERLSDRLAVVLRERIDRGDWAPGHRLPTERELTERFQVSRTVVREAVSRLKSMGLLTSRQGLGVFVAPTHAARALRFDPSVLGSLEAVLQVVEVRRSLEGEVAALAARRITPGKAAHIEAALEAIESAVARGEDGVEEDLRFHREIARATDNPQFERLLDFLEQYQRDAIRVTRTNEAMHGGFMTEVRAEHQAIASAVIAGLPEQAREAATLHMVRAADRIEQADASVVAALSDLLSSRGQALPAPAGDSER